jgi:phage terminase large subunit-like protein
VKALELAPIFAGRYRDSFFTESGPFARSKFPKSVEFFDATAHYPNVNCFGSNRSSKSTSLMYAAAVWLTGDYPEWWTGRRFEKPVQMWISGETGTLVRNNLQRYLIGSKEALGQISFITTEQIEHASWAGKPEGLCTSALIKSKYGTSKVEFKSYDQGQYRFASDTIDVVILDEEPKAGIFTEAITRVATTNGIVCCGFTALRGITPLVALLAPEFAGMDREDPKETGRKNIVISWADIPPSVLPYEKREFLKKSYLPHELKARTEGIPSVGSGMIYQISESDFVVPDFQVPDHWPRLFAMDPGFKDPTAITWWALDADNDAMYQYGEYYERLKALPIHVDVIHRHGDWMPGVFDYAGGNITDGKGVASEYRKAVRNTLHNANKSLTLGHLSVWDRMQTSRFFVFESMRHTRTEFRQYHRDDKGQIADTPHHLLDTWRYAATGVHHAKQRPAGYKFNGENMRTKYGPPQTVSFTEGFF